ncbi:MAG: DUF1266 domain-containing protein [Alphaproteobacteria bacterium]
MTIITEWAKIHPLLAAAVIIGFFVLIFGCSVLLILMLTPKGMRNRKSFQELPTKKITENEIIYKNTIDKFVNNALNFTIALGAPYAIANRQAVDIIETDPKTLIEFWKIKNKNALLNCLEQMRTVGSRRVDELMIASVVQKEIQDAQQFINQLESEKDKKVLNDIQHNRQFYANSNILAWDIVRAVMLIRSGTDAKLGYLTKDEAKNYLLQMAEPIFRQKMDWQQISKGFLAGRKLWQTRTNREADGMRKVIDLLLNDPNSPWLKQKLPTRWPKEALAVPMFAPQNFDAIIEQYFTRNSDKLDYTAAFHRMTEKASLTEIATFMNSFRYGLNYLSEGPLREVGRNLGLSKFEIRALAIAIMMGGMRVLSSLEQDIDSTMYQIADDVFVIDGEYITVAPQYVALDAAVQEMVVKIFDVAKKRKEHLWGLTITIEELQDARTFGKNSYPESLDWEQLPQFSSWVEHQLYNN